MFRSLVCVSLIINVCCIGWLVFNSQRRAGIPRTSREIFRGKFNNAQPPRFVIHINETVRLRHRH